MKTTTRWTLLVGLLVFAAACSEQPVAPDVKQVTPGAQDVKPGGGSALEAEINAAINDLFVQPNKNKAHGLASDMKDAGNAGEEDAAVAAATAIIELWLIGASTTEEPAVQHLANLLGQWLAQFGFDTGFGVIGLGGGTITASGAEAGIVIPPGGVLQATLFSIVEINGGCLIADIPQSDRCWRYTASPDIAFKLPAILGECHFTNFVQDGQEDLVRLHAQDVVGGVTKVVSLPLVGEDNLGFLVGNGTCVIPSTLGATDLQGGLLGLAHAGWQILKGGIAAVLSPPPLHADAAALAIRKAYGGTKGSLTDVTAALPIQMAISAGDGQTATTGTAVPIPPTVLVTAADGSPVAGATVHWTVTSVGGSATPLSMTGLDGRASSTWTLDGVAGTYTLVASGHGIANPLVDMESFNGNHGTGCLPASEPCLGPFADDPALPPDGPDFVDLGTGTLEFTAEGIPPPGGELVVINDVHVFSGATPGDGNAKLIDNLVSFSNNLFHGSGTIVWFDRGRSSKCADFNGCLDDPDLGTMISIINAGPRRMVNHDTGSNDRYGPIPEDVKVIFLWNPTVSLQQKEVKNIKMFLEGGGRVVLVGENKDFVGANGINFANKLLKGIGATMRVNSDNVACSGPTKATVNVDNPIMAGVTTGTAGGLNIDCASSTTMGIMDGDRLFSFNGMVLGGVAIDFTN